MLNNKKISILFLIVFSTFIVFSFEDSFGALFSYNTNPLNISWTTVNNALAFDTDGDGIIDTIYSANSLASPTQTWTKQFGTGTTPLVQTFSSDGTVTTIDISTFTQNQIGVSVNSINSGCTAYYSVKSILTGTFTTVANSGSGTIGGSNCHVSNDFMQRTDNRYGFFTYYANTGDTVCKYEIKANSTVVASSTTSGQYCASSGLRNAIVNHYGIDWELSTTSYFYNLTSAVSPITTTGNHLFNDTTTNIIKEINSGVTYANIIDKNATQYHQGLKRSNYFDVAYSVQQIDAPVWQDIFDLYYDTTIPNDEKIFYVHWKILKGDLTNEPTVFPIKKDGIDYIGLADATTNTIYYAIKPDISSYAFQSVLLDNYPPSLLSSSVATTMPSQTIALSTATSSYNISQKGITGLISGASLSPQSSVDRTIRPEFINDSDLLLHSIQPSTNTAVSVIVKNLPTDNVIKVDNGNLIAFGQNPIWSLIQPTADKSFSVDLPANHCFKVSTADGSVDLKVWESLGQLCASGAMPKTIVYSSNLSITFFSLPYGVAHTFDQGTSGLTTKVRHDTLPFNYTIQIFNSTGDLTYNTEYFANSTNIDLQTINTTGISLPALMRVYDDSNNQLYYTTLGSAGYLSQSVAWFNEWLTIEGFNLLFMLPIVFGAMFTRNTVGIGTMSTVMLIATLSWFGIIPIPDTAIYLMIFVAVVGVIAYKKLYD